MYKYDLPFFVIYSEIKFNFEPLCYNQRTYFENNVTNIYIKRGKLNYQSFDTTKKKRLSDNFVVLFNDDSVLLNLNKFGILVLIRGDTVVVDYNFVHEHMVYNNLIELIMPYFFLKNGFLILHAASCRYNDKTILFSADSGVGKTTLLLSLLKVGAEYISDDIVCIFKSENQYHCIGLDFTFPKANAKTIEMLGITKNNIISASSINTKSYISIESNFRFFSTVDSVVFLDPVNSQNGIRLREIVNPEKRLLEQTVGIWGLTGFDMIRLLSKWKHFSDVVNVYSMEYKKDSAFLEKVAPYLQF